MKLSEGQFGRSSIDIVAEHAEPGSTARPGMARNIKGAVLDFGISGATDMKSAPHFTWDQAHRENGR